MIGTGDQAPNFSFTNQDGKSVSLGDFSGKYVLLWWYPKADTPGWTIEGKGFRDRTPNFTSKNAVIVGASFDTPAENQHCGHPRSSPWGFRAAKSEETQFASIF